MRTQDKVENQTRHAAKVVGESAAGVPGEKDAAAHDVEMEEGGDERENAGGEDGSIRRSGTDGAMGEPVEKLREAGNANDDDQIADEEGAQRKCTLLHSCVEAGGERDVRHLHSNHGKAPVRPGTRHRHKIDQRTNCGAHERTLPVPAGERLQQGPAFRLHGLIVQDTAKGKVTRVLQEH